MFNGFFKRAAPASPKDPNFGFDTKRLDTTFNELQDAVRETTSLASSISSQLENRLHVTEQALTTVMCVVTEGIIITDDKCIIREWNTGAEIIFGYTAAEAVGQHVSILVDEADRKDIHDRFNQSEYSDKGNVNRIKTLKCRHKTGAEVLVEISINVFPFSETGFNMIAIVRDVTKQAAERAERERERLLLSAVLDAVSDNIVVRDGEGKWILTNHASRNMYGFKSEADYIGKTSAEIAEALPTFADHFAYSMATDETAWKERRTTRFETDIIDHQQQRQYHDVQKTPIYTKDKKREMLVVLARNITAIKEKREHILVAHKALNASSDIVIIADGEGKIQFVNKMFLIKYRFIDVRDVIGEKMSIVRSRYTPQATYELMWETIKSGKTWEGILTNVDTTGRELRVQSSIIPIVDQNLATSYFISIQKCLD
jgi:PAS domain S-box-containing protein